MTKIDNGSIETALSESEQRYRLLMENASVGIFISNPDGQIILANPAGCVMLGYSEPELRQLSLKDLFGQRESDQDPFELDDLLAGKKTLTEHRLRRKDGSIITVEIDAKRLPDGHFQGFVQDVTSRKQMESKLRASERRFRTLVEQSPLSTVTYRPDGTMIMFNQAACDLWRISDDQANHLLTNYNILEDERLVQQGLMPYIKRGFAGESTDIPVLEYDPEQLEPTGTETGNTQWVRGFIYPVKDEDECLSEVVIVHEDVTEKRKIEEMLHQAQKQDSLSILAGGVAHDFNNLLVAILGQISLAQAKLPASSPAREHIQKAIGAAEHAADLTRQLLAYSGKGRFEITAVDLNALIQENLHLFEVSVPKQVTLQLKPSADLPLVEVDLGQMQQLIMNLIINAAEAIGSRPGTVSIATGLEELETVDPLLWKYTGKVLAPGPYVAVVISDDGEGMDAEKLDQIFDPFYSTKANGRGLGLAAVLGIVRGLNGGLTVESQSGAGTTFRLYFPASREKKSVQQAAPGIETAPAGKKDGLVLVIDDERAVRQAVVDILALDGLEAITAVNGETGIELYREKQDEILLVLLDLSMPGLSGVETLQRLKELNSNVKVLLSSGYSQQELNRQFDQSAFAGFLQKPYSTDQLVQVIRRLLD